MRVNPFIFITQPENLKSEAMTLISKFLLILFLTFNFLPAQVWQGLNFVSEIKALLRMKREDSRSYEIWKRRWGGFQIVQIYLPLILRSLTV